MKVIYTHGYSSPSEFNVEEIKIQRDHPFADFLVLYTDDDFEYPCTELKMVGNHLEAFCPENF